MFKNKTTNLISRLTLFAERFINVYLGSKNYLFFENRLCKPCQQKSQLCKLIKQIFFFFANTVV